MAASLGFFQRKLVKVAISFVACWWGYWQWKQHAHNNDWASENTEWLSSSSSEEGQQLDELTRCLVGYLGQRGDWANIVALAEATRLHGDPNRVLLSSEGTVQHRLTLPYEAWPQLGWALRVTQDRMELNKTAAKTIDYDAVHLEGRDPNRLWFVRFELPLKIGNLHQRGAAVPWRWHMLRAEGCLRVVGADIPLPPSVEYQILKEIEAEQEQQQREQEKNESSSSSEVAAAAEDTTTSSTSSSTEESTVETEESTEALVDVVPPPVDAENEEVAMPPRNVHNVVLRFDWHRITLDDVDLLSIPPPSDRAVFRVYEREMPLGTMTIPAQESLVYRPYDPLQRPQLSDLKHPLDFYFFYRTEEEDLTE